MNRKMTLPELIPEAETILELEPEELAGFLLEHLHSMPGNREEFERGPFCKSLANAYDHVLCQKAFLEAWSFLEREGLLAAALPNDMGIYKYWFITRRGEKYKTHTDFEAFRKVTLFPKEFVHPDLARDLYPLFLHGDYETAIFKAFKTVEVKVRDAVQKVDPSFSANLIGTRLMNAAFKAEGGPLTDIEENPDERQAQGNCIKSVERPKL